MPFYLHLALTGLCKFFVLLLGFLVFMGGGEINLMKFRQGFSIFGCADELIDMSGDKTRSPRRVPVMNIARRRSQDGF